MPLPRGTDWKLVLTLLAAGFVGFASIVPLIVEWWPRLLGPQEQAQLQEFPLPIPVIVALGLIQNGLILGLAIVVGLALSKRVGFGAPELEAWRSGTSRPALGLRLAHAAAIGMVTGLALVGIDALVLLPRTGVDLATWMAGVPLWKRLLAGVFYGGIVEELLVRLFLVTVLAWGLGKVWKRGDGRPAPAAVWAAIVIATLLFAAGHIPMASRLGEITPWLLARVLVLNGIAGIVYGWLYTRRGLEAAIVAHAATHVPLQVLAGTAVTIAQRMG